MFFSLAAFYYPDSIDQSALGGSENATMTEVAVRMMLT
jgi:hypothetical protein